MKKLAQFILPLFLFVVLIAGVGGCHTNKLAGGGAYTSLVTNTVSGVVTTNTDLAFFVTDSAFTGLQGTIDGVFKYEQDNRAALWSISPNIKLSLDAIRPTASEIVVRYLALREIYKVSKTPGNLTPLQTALGDIKPVAAKIVLIIPNKGQ